MLDWLRSQWLQWNSSIGWLFLAAIAGIIGGRADAAVVALFPLLFKSFWVPVWALLGSTFVLVGIFVVPLVSYRRAHKVANRLNELDDSLLRLLSKTSKDMPYQMTIDLIFDDMLNDVLELIEDSTAISIFHHDSEDPNYLIMWQSKRVASETSKQARFYVGEGQTSARGVAGYTFLNQEPILVRMSRQGGMWIASDPRHIVLDERTAKNPKPEYRSYISMPLLGKQGQSIGVMCINSEHERTFDSDKVVAIVRAISARVTAAALISEQLAGKEGN